MKFLYKSSEEVMLILSIKELGYIRFALEQGVMRMENAAAYMEKVDPTAPAISEAKAARAACEELERVVMEWARKPEEKVE